MKRNTIKVQNLLKLSYNQGYHACMYFKLKSSNWKKQF